MLTVMFATGVLLMTTSPAEQALEAAIQTDRDFAAYAAENGIAEAFRAYAAEDGRLIQPDIDDIVGPEAIYQSRANAEGLLHWEPRGGYAGEAGDFAVTYGDWSYHTDGERNSPPAATGNYVSVWRLESAGWRYVLDTGVTNSSGAASE